MPYRSPDQRAVTPQHRGRFPGFDVLDQASTWDAVTAGVVLARLALPDQLAFFSPPEVAIATPLLDLLLAQDREPKIPVLQLIDNRLAIGETDGWHYDDMAQDAHAWRQSLAELDADAADKHSGRGFAHLVDAERAPLVQAVQDLSTNGARWRGRNASHVWSLWTRYACTAFYSHPWAWNEIGFPGPAYPRGYLNPGVGTLEHWEVADHDDSDPVPFSERIERARAEHGDLLGDATGRSS